MDVDLETRKQQVRSRQGAVTGLNIRPKLGLANSVG